MARVVSSVASESALSYSFSNEAATCLISSAIADIIFEIASSEIRSVWSRTSSNRPRGISDRYEPLPISLTSERGKVWEIRYHIFGQKVGYFLKFTPTKRLFESFERTTRFGARCL